MIRDASSMDRPVDKGRGLSGRGRVWLGAAIALILILTVLYPSIKRWAQSETSIAISRVRIGTVSRGDLVRDVSVEGRVVAAFHPTLFSPAPGIVQLLVKAGDSVIQGQELALVDSPELRSRLEQERSNLLVRRSELDRQRILTEQSVVQNQQEIGLLEVELEAARRAMDRAQRTRAEGILNAVEYETAQDNVRIAELKLEVARKQAVFATNSLEFDVQNRQSQVDRQQLLVDELARQVEKLTMRSPVDGMVSRVQIQDQDAVGQRQPVVTVVDLSAFEVEVFVPENYADEAIPPVEAIIQYEGQMYRGELRSISPEVEGSRVKGVVAFTEDLPGGLKQNQRVSTRLILETRQNVLKVDRGPFVESGGGRLAYVIEDGMAILRPIEVGGLSVAEAQIVRGLDVGDRIIISDIARFEGAEKVLLRR
jgi:HlyD family secretion protein